MTSKGIAEPYSARVSSWFCERTVPSRSRPAKRPFDREYVRNSALSFQSVPAWAFRPTGPAEAAASAPSLNLFLSMSCRPFWFMAMRTRSVDWPPICQPKLPPASCTKTGALHPLGVRQVETPWPYCAPTTKAPLLYAGMMVTQDAPARMPRGTPLSGVAMISFITASAAVRRSSSFDLSASWAKLGSEVVRSTMPHKTAVSRFIGQAFRKSNCSVPGWGAQKQAYRPEIQPLLHRSPQSRTIPMTGNRVAELSSGMGTQEILGVGTALAGPTNQKRGGAQRGECGSNKKRGLQEPCSASCPAFEPLSQVCCVARTSWAVGDIRTTVQVGSVAR